MNSMTTAQFQLRQIIRQRLQLLDLVQVHADFPRGAEMHRGVINQFDPAMSAACTLCNNLIDEEVNKELLPAVEKYKTAPSLENLVELFDAGVDSIYVILQLMYQLDLPVLEGFIEVHASNLEKLQRGENGQLLKRADGKLLKPADWQPPNLMAVVDAHLALRQRELKLHGAENWSAE